MEVKCDVKNITLYIYNPTIETVENTAQLKQPRTKK